MKKTGRSIAVGVTLAIAALGMTACGAGEEPKSKVDKIDETINSALKLENEIYAAVNRLIIDCMEKEGFDVHAPNLSTDTATAEDEEEHKPLIGSEAPDEWDVPTTKAAKKEGFGSNILMDPNYEPSEDEEMMEGPAGPDDEAFYEESEDYQKEYEIVQYGQEYYEAMNPKDDEDISMDDEWPLEGGCTGEVNEAVFGEPISYAGEDDDDGEKYYGVAYPEGMEDYEAQDELYETKELIDARDELSKCVESKDYPYIEHTEDWGLGYSYYADAFYEENEGMWSDMGDDGPEMPEYDLPPGAPWKEFEDAFAEEVKLATTVAECAESTGFRDTMQKSWDAAMEKTALDNEAEIYSWHDDLKAVLETAQDLIKQA